VTNLIDKIFFADMTALVFY